MTQTLRKPTRILTEGPPDERALARIEQAEQSVDEEGVPNLEGMDLDTYAEFCLSLMPGHVNGYAPSHPPLQATGATPGSPEKQQVMAQRARRGLCLFHPADCRQLPDAPPPEPEPEPEERPWLDD